MERFSFGRLATLAVIVVLFGALPWLISDALLPEATRVLVIAGAAMSLNILVGATGLISLGQGLFFGLGAYVVAIGTIRHDLSFWESGALALALAVPLSVIVALISLRARHMFFGLLTLAIGQVAYVFVARSYDLTGGDDGLVGITVPAWLDNDIAQHGFALAVLAVVSLLLMRLLASPFGALLGAVRDNPDRVASLGENPKRVELAAMVIAGVAGCIFGIVWAGTEGSVEPGLFSWVTSAILLMMVALGGRSMFFGPLLGAIVLELTRTYVQIRSPNADLVVGIVIILCAVSFPEGIGPSVHRRLGRVFSRSVDAAAGGRAQEAR